MQILRKTFLLCPGRLQLGPSRSKAKSRPRYERNDLINYTPLNAHTRTYVLGQCSSVKLQWQFRWWWWWWWWHFPDTCTFSRLNGQLTLIPATTAFRSVPFRTVSATTAVTLHH